MTMTYDLAVAAAEEEENGGRPLVLVERSGARAIITLDDAEKLNPLSAALTVQLHRELSALARQRDVRAIVITGRDPAFSAGGDLRLMREVAQPMIDDSSGGATEIWRWIRNQFGGIARLITRTDKAFISAVNGTAAGVGLAFALACDVMILSDRARIVPAFGRIGLVPEVGTSWQLTRRLGYQRTFGTFVSGRHLSGSEAFELGLGNALVEHDQLLPAALEWCERVEQMPTHVLEMSKSLLRQCADLTWDQAVTMEEFAEPMCFTTSAHEDAVRQLLNG